MVPVAKLRFTPSRLFAPALLWQASQLRPLPLREGALSKRNLPSSTNASVKTSAAGVGRIDVDFLLASEGALECLERGQARTPLAT